MKHQGLAVFPLFFGLSLLEAVQGRHWITAALWLGFGVLFVVLDERGRVPSPPRPRGKPEQAG